MKRVPWVALAVAASFSAAAFSTGMAWADAAAGALPIGYSVDVDESGTTTSSDLGGTGSLTGTGQGNVNYGFAQECEPGPGGGPFSEGYYPPLKCNGDPRKNLGRAYASKGSPETPSGFWFTGNEHCVNNHEPYSGSEFTWHVQLPQAGLWHVEVYIPEWTSYAFGARYIQTSDEGQFENEFTQQAYNGKWVYLFGSHQFAAGQEYTVRLPIADREDSFCHYQMADQMKWVYDGILPTAFATNALATGATTERVEGSVNPAGQATEYHVAYDLASSAFCKQYEGSPARSTTPVALGVTDEIFHAVSVGLSGLTAGTEYCAEIVAVNGSGTSLGSTPTFFTAGAPAAVTDAFATGPTTESVEGDVNPASQATEYHVAYDLLSSGWCRGSGSPAHSTTPVALGFTDANYHAVSVGLSGLTAGTEYCAELIAVNGSGTGHGFTAFTAGAPAAAADAPFATGPTTERVEGSVNPAGQATEYHVGYDLASSEWCMTGYKGVPAHSTTPVALGFTDANYHAISVGLSGLTAGTKYCAELIAVNGAGTAHSPPVSFTAGAPSASTFNASATAPTTESVEGSVNPAGQATEYHVVYDLASSEWCTSFGSIGVPAHSTTPVALGFTDATYHAISVGLSGLTAGTEYCAALIAVNGSGTSPSSTPTFFTAGAPAALTYTAFATGPTTESVKGYVNPAGQATEYHVGYDLASSEWCTSFGSIGVPAHSTTPVALGFTDATYHAISVGLSGLTAGTRYCAELIAVNGSGTGYGSTTSFTAGPKPTITNLSPRRGTTAGATVVTITGTNLGGAMAVHFGAAAATIKTDTATKITAESPAHAAGQVDVTVVTPEGTSSLSSNDHFQFTPTVTGLNPHTGLVAGGTSVMVTGTGFALGTTSTTFKFGAIKGTSVNCTSTTTCTVVAPRHEAGTVDVSATVNKASSAKNPPSDQFTYH